MSNAWGTPLMVTLAHAPTEFHRVSSLDDAIALTLHRDWGDMFSEAYVTAQRALFSAKAGQQPAMEARRCFCAAADAAGATVVEMRGAILDLSASSEQHVA